MPFTKAEKAIIEHFFRQKKAPIRQLAQDYVDEHGIRPTPDVFKELLAAFVGRAGSGFQNVKALLTIHEMERDRAFIDGCCSGIIASVPLPASRRPSAAAVAAPPGEDDTEEWLRNAVFVSVFARQIPAAKADAARKLDIPQADAAKAVNWNDASDSLLNGIYLHKTERSSSDNYGVKDTDGIHKITYFYERGGRGLYLVGYGTHKSRAKAEYLVQKSLTTRLHKGDVLRFH